MKNLNFRSECCFLSFPMHCIAQYPMLNYCSLYDREQMKILFSSEWVFEWPYSPKSILKWSFMSHQWTGYWVNVQKLFDLTALLRVLWPLQKQTDLPKGRIAFFQWQRGLYTPQLSKLLLITPRKLCNCNEV